MRRNTERIDICSGIEHDVSQEACRYAYLEILPLPPLHHECVRGYETESAGAS